MKATRTQRLGLFGASFALLVGCQADISGGSKPSGGVDTNGDGIPDAPGVDLNGDGIPDAPGGPGPMVDPGDPNAAGPMPLRRLNRREYNNTVRQLLGTTSRPADSFAADHDGTFNFPRAGLVAILDAEHLQEAAEKLVAEANIASLLPCASADAACAKTFIEQFGLKAFRRPVTPDEVARLTALYDKARGELMLDFNQAIGVVLEGMLQAPGFLYRWEQGPVPAKLDGPVVKLGPYEVASRLSYFLLRSMPDQALLDAAAAGALGTEAEVTAQAQRLLALPQAREAVASFFGDWLRMSAEAISVRDKDQQLYPEFQPDLQAAMAEETQRFVSSVLFEGDGTFQSLLTSPATSLNGPLAQLYGAQGSGSAFAPATLNGAQRSGLLTRAAFLTVTGAANGSNPVKRGKRIYENLLCRELTPPPGVVIPPADPPEAGGTTRERFQRHEENSCAGCHVLLDPLGFAFENYDGIGKWRDTDNGSPVNAAATTMLDGVSVSFNNGVELSSVLAASAEVRDCFARQWVRYALDRVETDYDTASIQTAATAFAQGTHSIPALVASVSTIRSFRYRMLAEGEVTQ